MLNNHLIGEQISITDVLVTTQFCIRNRYSIPNIQFKIKLLTNFFSTHPTILFQTAVHMFFLFVNLLNIFFHLHVY